jgi:hypothetical protein
LAESEVDIKRAGARVAEAQKKIALAKLGTAKAQLVAASPERAKQLTPDLVAPFQGSVFLFRSYPGRSPGLMFGPFGARIAGVKAPSENRPSMGVDVVAGPPVRR